MIRSRYPRILLFLVLSAGLLVSSGCVSSTFRKFIYYPRRYRAQATSLSSGSFRWVRYRTSQGNQVAFYQQPREGSGELPKGVWVFFGGNATTALRWVDFVEEAARAVPGDGFLLFDYPGYGYCAGVPTRKTIRESSDAAVIALAGALRASPEKLESRLCVIGHSLGAAVGLEFATRHPVEQVILLAPFTSINAMARGVVGWPLCYLAPDRYDNVARMKELAARRPRPRIEVFHGTDDGVIPFSMGQTLAEAGGDAVRFYPVEGAGHNNLPSLAAKEIIRCMSGQNR